MSADPTSRTPFRVLVPVSDNEASAQAQARFVASLPDAQASVESTLTHVLHDEELDAPRDIRSAQRVGTVVHARDYLRERDIDVQVMDAEEPSPTDGIVALADEIDADLVVLGGGMHGFIEDLLTGHTVRSVGRRANRPITVVPEAFADPPSDE